MQATGRGLLKNRKDDPSQVIPEINQTAKILAAPGAIWIPPPLYHK